jgi:O-antigen/teichoic acid export membrane protein
LPLKVLSLIAWHDLSLFAITMVAEACLSGALAYLAYTNRNADRPKLRFSSRIAADLMRQSLPQLALGFLTVLQARVDQIMLGQLLGEAALGRYALALRVIELAAGLPAVVMASISPALAHAYARDPRLFFDRVLNSYRFMILVSLAVSVPILLAAWMAELIDRRASELALAWLLAMLVPRLMLSAMGLVKTQYLTNERLLRWGLATALAGACANLAGNSLLIPIYGVPGAIVATSISFFLQIVLLDAVLPVTRENFFLMLRGLLTFWKFKIT